MIEDDKSNIDTKKEAEADPDKPVVTTDEQVTDSELPLIEEVTPNAEHTVLAKGTLNKRGFRAFISTKKGKAILVVALLIVLVGVLLAVPMTRYGILGTFLKKSITVAVADSVTKKPVSQALVSVGDFEAKTDNNGKATISNVPVGDYATKTTKKYYEDGNQAYTVPIIGNSPQVDVALKPTGRQVTIKVANFITKAVLAKANVIVGDTSALTNEKGIASIVLPADKSVLKAKVELKGYNTGEFDVKVTEQEDANVAVLTPVGSIFYLSKATGKIDVMKSNLDGTNAQVVAAGTGNESETETVLLAARDWNYLALSAKRDATKKGQLFLVNASNDKLTTIDEGDATFQLVGWSNHRFVYLVDRDKKPWEEKQRSLKSYDADTGKTTVLDETQAAGTGYSYYQQESLLGAYILGDTVMYTKPWTSIGFGPMTARKSTIMSIKADGSQKQTLKEFTANNYINIDARAYEPKAVDYKVDIDDQPASYYEYENGKVEAKTSDANTFYAKYPTYLVSPDSKKTFWSDPRDGGNTLIVGDTSAKEITTLATLSEFAAYGWYGDEYVLLSKNGSELYIASANTPFTDALKPLKITNYHKPNVSYPGYGYGYGGL